MNRWRIVIIIIVLFSLGMILFSAWYGRDSRMFVDATRDSRVFQPPFARTLSDASQAYPILTGLGAFLALYLCGILVLYTMPVQIRRMGGAFSARPVNLVRIFLVGFLIAILVGAISFGSSLVMSTFPLTIFLGSILFISGLIGIIALAYAMGQSLFMRAELSRSSPLTALLFGLLLIYALIEVPLLGFILRIILVSLGIGAVVTTRFGSGKPWSLLPLVEPDPMGKTETSRDVG